MHYNTDFEGVKDLMAIGTICGCIAAIHLPKLIFLPWEVLVTMDGVDDFNYAQSGIGSIILTLLFLIPAFYRAAQKCHERINKREISKKDAWGSYFMTVLIYFLGGAAFCSASFIFGPPIMELRHDMAPSRP